MDAGVIADSIVSDAEWYAEIGPTFYRTRARLLQYLEDANAKGIPLSDGTTLVRAEWGARDEVSLAAYWKLEVRK